MTGLRKGCLYVGIRGQVVALDDSTGSELWRTRLKGLDYVSVTSEGARVYAATRGEVYALEPHTGTVVWHNRLPGMGLGIVGLLAGAAGVDPTAAVAQELRGRQQKKSSAAGA